MLSSLVPGAIFQTSGLNRKSTPTPPNVTPSELEKRYRRDAFNGTDWPHDSPVSRMYDVGNTSSSLIILNNKYGKNSTRLRGYYSGPPSSERFIDPNRHRAKSPRNPDHHYRCHDSSSPKFEPTISTGLDWSSMSNRPPSSLIAKSSVNAHRHRSCKGRQDGPPSTPGGERPRSRMSLPPPRYFTDYSDMSLGETLYMWSIEKIYNVENLKQLKQEQYRKLLQLEAKKGYHGYTDYAKYLRYINNAPNRTYGTRTGTPRAKSAFSYRSTSGRTSPVKTLDQRTDDKTEKDHSVTNDKSDEPPKRPQTSIPTTRQEDKQEDKEPPVRDGKQEKPAPPTPVEDNATKGQGSRSPTRSSRSSLQNLGSTKSLRSKSSSKPSSRASSAKSVQSKDNAGKSEKSDHREGIDRPKSRLGRLTGEGTSKSKVVDDKRTENIEKPKNKNEKINSRSSSVSSLDKNDKMGSISSISSKSSNSSSSNSVKKADKIGMNDPEVKDVKVHRIPSAVELKDEPDNEEQGIDVREDNQTSQQEQQKSEKEQKHVKELEKSVKFSDIPGDIANKTDEEKFENQDGAYDVNKSDDAKESENQKDQLKNETTKNRLSRQDSFDEGDDDDRRVNRDLDKIEY